MDTTERTPFFARLPIELIKYVEEVYEATGITKQDIATVIFTFSRMLLSPEAIAELYDIIELRGSEALTGWFENADNHRTR